MHVRIIPMSLYDETFVGKCIEEIQKDFFKDYLINVSKGWYYYGKSGLEANSGDLLLFQMNSQVIASAILEDVIQFTKPTIDGNTGALILDRRTIKVFPPIKKEELSLFIKKFISFNQVKQKFDVKDVDFPSLEKRMKEND